MALASQPRRNQDQDTEPKNNCQSQQVYIFRASKLLIMIVHISLWDDHRYIIYITMIIFSAVFIMADCGNSHGTAAAALGGSNECSLP